MGDLWALKVLMGPLAPYPWQALRSLVLHHYTALHKDAMQYNDIALGTLGFTKGREPEAP